MNPPDSLGNGGGGVLFYGFKGSADERRIIHDLSLRARFGEREAGYLVNESTGVILHFAEAEPSTPYEVEFPAGIFKLPEHGGQRFTFIHSHPVNCPPSESDWSIMVEHEPLVRFITVCDSRYFVLERTAQTKNPHRVSPASVFLFEQQQLLKQSSVGGHSIKRALLEIPEDELFDVLCAVNHKMAQTYGVRFQEVQL